MLDDPFVWSKHQGDRADTYNLDALMSSTEQCIFTSLRISFDAAAMETEEGVANAGDDMQSSEASPTRSRVQATPLTSQVSFDMTPLTAM